MNGWWGNSCHPFFFFIYMLHVLKIPFVQIDEAKLKMASKTKGIFAHPVVTLFNDVYITSKLSLITQEGPQPIKDGSILCTGLSKTDPWQQSAKKLLDKYTVTDITPDGWMYCEPKPDNTIKCFQVTQESLPQNEEDFEDHTVFQIYAQWGDKVEPTPGEVKYIQLGEVGDYVCQSVSDPTDTWIVKQSFFNATYEFK